ncbi:MAG: YvcK family protein [Acidobacteriota bacterium]|nr:YvcK family protein [Acidobacteriota bacterium]
MGSVPKKRSLPVRVVALGGGTGLSAVLRGLKQHVAANDETNSLAPIADLTAVVTVTDDGGSSGRLRREYRVLPPGDIRNCLVALSPSPNLLGNLFQYRFPAGRGLAGHSFGNLFVTALTNITGDFPKAVQVSAQVLAIRGQIFPSTEQNVTLEAELADGTIVPGETKISKSRKPIARIRLVPSRVRPLPEVVRAIRKADLILVGPGSLYTSILPNLLVPGILRAMMNARAQRVYIANLMTQPGETRHYTVADHVRAIYEHTRARVFDVAVINRTPVKPRLLRLYAAQGAEPVDPSYAEMEELGLRCVSGAVLREDGKVRHHEARLATLLMDSFVRGGPPRRR